MASPQFRGGRNIALKIPPHQFEQSLAFYRDVLRLAPWPEEGDGPSFVFGECRLWLDKCPGLSQAEVWLEVVTDDLDGASAALEAAGVTRCDEIEPLPDGFAAFWIASPCQVVHLVCED
ncbi:MAG: hypothetical protein ACK4P3_03640 [Fimbriimonadaceae bacterium]